MKIFKNKKINKFIKKEKEKLQPLNIEWGKEEKEDMEILHFNNQNFVSVVDVEIVPLREDIKLPKYEHNEYDNSGMDLYSAIICFKEENEWKEFDSGVIYPGETALIKTGVAMAIPKGLELQIRPTSGNSLKTKLRIANSPGTIDASYRGEIGIIVENIGNTIITIEKNSKIAQGVICPIFHANFKIVDKLDNTIRGTKGYGSTGTVNGK